MKLIPRMTTRRWMIAVGVLAVALAAGLEGWRLAWIVKVRWGCANELDAWALNDRAAAATARELARSHRERLETLRQEKFTEPQILPSAIAGGFTGGSSPRRLSPSELQARRERWADYQQREIRDNKTSARNREEQAARLEKAADERTRTARRFRDAARRPWLPVPPDPPAPE